MSAGAQPVTPILIIGAGRMGGALVEGWEATGAFAAGELILRDPHPGEAALAAQARGAALNPPDADLARARTVLVAVKPQLWRQAAAQVAPHLAADAVIISIAAGVSCADLASAFDGRSVARVMPTTAVAIAKGVASIWPTDARAKAAAHALFGPVARAVDLPSEDMVDVAVGVSGSSPAYLYAFIEALEAAGVAQGLTPELSSALVRGTLIGAAALLDRTGEDPAELRRQVTSPNGTTAAALAVLMGDAGLGPLADQAVDAAVKRSRELGA